MLIGMYMYVSNDQLLVDKHSTIIHTEDSDYTVAYPGRVLRVLEHPP